ncbi:aldehyde dehydrogenase family protein [Parasphingorhabdus sp.]|uniref:aldehyde dehydrogenase family protein n=1 Tax=Parasphingorhabdus sp. TaxID=2709688 RepID=UPI0032F035AA
MSITSYFENIVYGPSHEDDGSARAWLKDGGAQFGHLINGKSVEPIGGEYFETLEPATGQGLAHIALGRAADVEAAVSAARQAQPSWAKLSGHRRARFLYAMARSIQRNSRLISVIEALDNGKPIREARDIDIPLAARHFLYHAGWAQIQGQEFCDFEPLGVIGQIVPWNFPALMFAWKVAPALALGNTVVLKPAEQTPLSALLLGQLAVEIGLPPGVLNIVCGDGETGSLIVDSPDVDKVAFTGSTEVGRLIRSRTAGTGKSLTLELGGKSPFLVFEDADLDSAVEGVVDSIWFNQGQVCCAGSRLLVQESVADIFLAKLRQRMSKLRIGHPLEKSIDMGAIIDAAQLLRIQSLVDRAVADGADCYQPDLSLPNEGFFFPPTLLTNVQPCSEIVQEEIFGPVLCAMTFRTPDEAITLSNNSRYGLSASVWSETIGLAFEVAAKVKVGVVWINAANLFDASVGFGGVRESGFGREGGREGVLEYLHPRAWPRERGEGQTTLAPFVAKATTSNDAKIDRTSKLFIGGRQVRADAGYSKDVYSPDGQLIGQVPRGDRKDVRNAVEAARSADGWSSSDGHHRAQILYYIAENLSARADEFSERLTMMTGISSEEASNEVQASVDRLFSCGAWADKFEGVLHQPPMRGVALAIPEPIGVIGILCPDEAPLLSFISLVGSAICVGNRVVAVPSERWPLAVTDFIQVLETSDLPSGVVNIVTGERSGISNVLAEHDDLDSIWVFGSGDDCADAERLSIGNLKRTLVRSGSAIDWMNPAAAEGRVLLRHAVQVKNIWAPYGD